MRLGKPVAFLWWKQAQRQHLAGCVEEGEKDADRGLELPGLEKGSHTVPSGAISIQKAVYL